MDLGEACQIGVKTPSLLDEGSLASGFVMVQRTITQGCQHHRLKNTQPKHERAGVAACPSDHQLRTLPSKGKRISSRLSEGQHTLSGKVTALWVCLVPSFFERGLPSPPTRRRPTRLTAEVIHLPVIAFSTFVGVGVDVRVCFEAEAVLLFFADAIVGVMKLAFELLFVWFGVPFGVGIGEPVIRMFLLMVFEVMSVRVPIFQRERRDTNLANVTSSKEGAK